MPYTRSFVFDSRWFIGSCLCEKTVRVRHEPVGRTTSGKSWGIQCRAFSGEHLKGISAATDKTELLKMSGAGTSGCLATAAHVGCRESDPSSVGMMEGAFFVGRSELLEWLNSTLALKLTRVEQCASACVYIQALDALLGPKSRVAMSKVKWSARHEYEFIQNFKVLQAAFDAHGIQKYIEVNKLVRAKYQDNLEFLQWLKAFVDRQAPLYASDVPYNPIERRRVS